MIETHEDTAIRVHPAEPDSWDAVATVIGERGDPSWCWCQYFRLRGQAWREATAESNERALRAQVCDSGTPPGVIAYAGAEPIGWCAVAPKTAYPKVVASRITGDDTNGVWSITCFVVRVGHRRQGVAQALLEGAVAFARTAGAQAVEGYPIDPDRRASMSASELFHGTIGLFERAGFAELSRPTQTRVVMRLALND